MGLNSLIRQTQDLKKCCTSCAYLFIHYLILNYLKIKTKKLKLVIQVIKNICDFNYLKFWGNKFKHELADI